MKLTDGTPIKVCPCRPPKTKPSQPGLNMNEAEDPLLPSTSTKSSSGTASLTGSISSLHSLESEDIDSKLGSAILARLDRMTLDFNAKLQATQNAQEEMNEKLKDWPTLVRTVQDHSEAIEELRRENQELRQKFDVASTNQYSRDPPSEERFSSLEKTTSTLTTQISQLKTDLPRVLSQSSSTSVMPKNPSTNQLVVSGLTVPEGANYRKLAFAVLKPLYPELEVVDISSARPMAPKAPKQPREALATPSIHVEETDAAAELESSSPPSVPPTDDSGSTTRPSTRPQRPPSIIVTLASASLVPTLIRGKIRHKNLHTNQLDKEELTNANITTPLQPALINVNEYLPGDTFKLLRWVRSKRKPGGFSCFTRDGCIYVRWTKSSPAVMITRPEDMEDFLSESPHRHQEEHTQPLDQEPA